MGLILNDEEAYASTIKGIETRALGAEITDSGYPMSTDRVPTRRLVLIGKTEKGKLHGELVKLQRIAARKRIITGRDEITPPLLSDEERGASNTTNARMHRLLGGRSNPTQE